MKRTNFICSECDRPAKSCTEANEQSIHAKFRHVHERGEWFRRTPGLVAYIEWISGKSLSNVIKLRETIL